MIGVTQEITNPQPCIYWLIEHIRREHRYSTEKLHHYCYELICLMLDSPLKIKEADNKWLLACLVRDACSFSVLDEHKKIAMGTIPTDKNKSFKFSDIFSSDVLFRCICIILKKI